MFHLLLLEKFVQGNQVQSQGLKSGMRMIIDIDPSEWLWNSVVLEKFVQGNQVQSQRIKSDVHMIINIDPFRGV